MRNSAILCLVALSGCATSSKIQLPNNEAGFAIECPHPGQCYNKAAEICAPLAYELIDKGALGQGAVTMGRGGFGAFETKTTLIVKCVPKQ